MSFLSYSKQFQGLPDIFLRDPKRYLPIAQFLEILMNGESEFSPAEREMVARKVSDLNTCQYCVGIHDAVLGETRLDGDSNSPGATSSTAKPDAKMQPVLDLAEKLTLTPARMVPADFEAVRAAGWSDQAVEDVIDVVSLFSLLNRLVDGFGVRGSLEHFQQTGGMAAQHGYGPLVQMIQEKAEAA